MNQLFNPATRTAELLQQRSIEGQLEMIDSAISERRARMIITGGAGYAEIEWHGIRATGSDVYEMIDNWIVLALFEAGELA